MSVLRGLREGPNHSLIKTLHSLFLLGTSPDSFERQDLLRTGAGDNFSGAQLLGKPAPQVPPSQAIDQQGTKCLYHSGLPQMELCSCLRTRPAWRPPSDSRNAPHMDKRATGSCLVHEFLSLGPITGVHIFSSSLQNGMESEAKSLKNFYWPRLSFVLAS